MKFKSGFRLKGVLHGTTSNVGFSRNNVARKIEHSCEFLNPNKKLATRCRVKCCAKNCPRCHATWCSIFRVTLSRENRRCKLSRKSAFPFDKIGFLISCFTGRSEMWISQMKGVFDWKVRIWIL